jgi:hypothetical protein
MVQNYLSAIETHTPMDNCYCEGLRLICPISDNTDRSVGKCRFRMPLWEAPHVDIDWSRKNDDMRWCDPS